MQKPNSVLDKCMRLDMDSSKILKKHLTGIKNQPNKVMLKDVQRSPWFIFGGTIILAGKKLILQKHKFGWKKRLPKMILRLNIGWAISLR